VHLLGPDPVGVSAETQERQETDARVTHHAVAQLTGWGPLHSEHIQRNQQDTKRTVYFTKWGVTAVLADSRIHIAVTAVIVL
jgi:hypothetical protein